MSTAGRTAAVRRAGARSARRAPAGGSSAGSTSGSARCPGLGLGAAMLWMSLLVLLPLAAVVVTSTERRLARLLGLDHRPRAAAALRLTIGSSLLVCAVNAVMGTLVAWVLVRDASRASGCSSSSSTCRSRCRRSSPAW